MNTAPEATQVTNVRSKAKHLIESEKVRKYRSKPLEMCEPLQVAHYGEGDYFVRHFDNPSGSLQRCCTVIFYLNDPIRGGCTSFPRAHSLTFGCSSSGIKVYPKKGRALVFFSVRNGAEDRNSLHEGNAVEQGEKWIATQWFTESNCF